MRVSKILLFFPLMCIHALNGTPAQADSVKLLGVCVDTGKSGDRIVAESVRDYYLVSIWDHGDQAVKIFIGRNPDLRPGYGKYVRKEYRQSLDKARDIDMGDNGILGVSPHSAVFYHIYGGTPSAMKEASKAVKFCD